MSDIQKAVAALRKPYLISENRASVVVYRDDLTLVLDRLEELEAAAAKEPDVESVLEVEDEVESLINALDAPKGSRGIVYRINDQDEYPIQINYEGRKYPVGYKRFELGKVEK